jgi:hypothetical protein
MAYWQLILRQHVLLGLLVTNRPSFRAPTSFDTHLSYSPTRQQQSVQISVGAPRFPARDKPSQTLQRPDKILSQSRPLLVNLRSSSSMLRHCSRVLVAGRRDRKTTSLSRAVAKRLDERCRCPYPSFYITRRSLMPGTRLSVHGLSLSSSTRRDEAR